MQKEKVIELINSYKGRPIIIGLADEGVTLYGNIEGHWLFVDGDNLVEVHKNVNDGSYGFAGINQKTSPFEITTIAFDTVNYVRSFIGNASVDITKNVSHLTPIGTDKSIDDIVKELQTDSIHRANSTRGNYSSNTTYGTDYGAFRGHAVSTDIDGIPEAHKK